MATKRGLLPSGLHLVAFVCLCLLVSVCCSPGSPRPACILALVPLTILEGSPSPPPLKCRQVWLFLWEGASGFPCTPVASSPPTFCPLWGPLFCHEGERHFGGTGGLGREGMGLGGNGLFCKPPFLGEPGDKSGSGLAEPQAPSSALFSPRCLLSQGEAGQL